MDDITFSSKVSLVLKSKVIEEYLTRLDRQINGMPRDRHMQQTQHPSLAWVMSALAWVMWGVPMLHA